METTLQSSYIVPGLVPTGFTDFFWYTVRINLVFKSYVYKL